MLMKNPRHTTGRTSVTSAIGTVIGLALVIGVIAIAAVVGFRLFDSPFSTTEVDHSAPPVLLELRDLASFHAAQGQFEVTVDVEQDVKWVPSFLAGERVQFVSVGTVDAIVDFSMLTEASFVVDEDASAVTVTLPPVRLQDPVIDLEISHVMNRDRGLLDRLGGVFTDSPTSEAELYELATDKIAAAADATELADRAEQNVRATVTAMLQAVGFDRVVVRFEPIAAGPASGSPLAPAAG